MRASERSFEPSHEVGLDAPSAALQARSRRRDEPGDAVWTQTSRRELVLLAVYFAAVVAITDILNVRLGVELLTLTVGVAAVAISRCGKLFIRDWWFFLVGLILWNLSGPIAAGSPFPHHLAFMINLDRWLFHGHEPVAVIQHALMHPGQVGPLDVATALAYNMHLPEPYIAGYFLWRLSRTVYLQYAAAVLVLLVVGLITFILVPAIPPWMAAKWYGQIPGVINGFGPVLQAHPLPFHGTPIFYIFKLRGDAVAAFPSEHAAFPMLEFLAFSHVIGRRSLWLLLWVAVVLFSILYLGEHWVTDALAGYLYAVVIFFAIRRFVTLPV